MSNNVARVVCRNLVVKPKIAASTMDKTDVTRKVASSKDKNHGGDCLHEPLVDASVGWGVCSGSGVRDAGSVWHIHVRERSLTCT